MKSNSSKSKRKPMVWFSDKVTEIMPEEQRNELISGATNPDTRGACKASIGAINNAADTEHFKHLSHEQRLALFSELAAAANPYKRWKAWTDYLGEGWIKPVRKYHPKPKSAPEQLLDEQSAAGDNVVNITAASGARRSRTEPLVAASASS